jgi:hypothetical protein
VRREWRGARSEHLKFLAPRHSFLAPSITSLVPRSSTPR